MSRVPLSPGPHQAFPDPHGFPLRSGLFLTVSAESLRVGRPGGLVVTWRPAAVRGCGCRSRATRALKRIFPHPGHKFRPGNPRRVVRAGLLIQIRVTAAPRGATVVPMPAVRGLPLLADVAFLSVP